MAISSGSETIDLIHSLAASISAWSESETFMRPSFAVSPRSPARQSSPASNTAFDRKPRSTRSDSSSFSLSRVTFSLTSSIP